MTIEKRSENCWRISQYYKGKRYRVTIDHKPTNKEATILLAEEMAKDSISQTNDMQKTKRGSFKECAEKDLARKNNVYSSSTIKNYKSVLKNLSDWFCEMNIYDITQVEIQAELNDYAIGRNPKTVANASGFIRTIMEAYRPQMEYKVKLPAKIKNLEVEDEYAPTDDDVKKLIKAFEGTDYELAFWLSIYGLRRSEMLAICPKTDLNGNILTIHDALVVGEDKGYQRRGKNKTYSSTREIYIDDFLVEKLKGKETVYDLHPNSFLKRLHTIQDSLGIPRFKLHAMRYYFVSAMHAKGIPDKYIQESGGWSSPYVMNKIYKKKQKDVVIENQKKIASFISGLNT